VLPLSLLGTACLSLLAPFGIGLALTLGLPWTFLVSFVAGAVYAVMPNLSEYAALFMLLVPPLAINTLLLYALGAYIDSRNTKPQLI
jgi:hypothetical protein